MSKFGLVSVSTLALVAAAPVWAQDDVGATAQSAQQDSYGEDIVVTAQRQSQRLQDVPIAVSAFTAEALESQQIENASDLQLTLPNVTFTKSNFTGSSFTIRGIGDLCTGFTCDSATAIHINGSPLFGTRLFETEYFDLERVEVLRGPQGTLFGRNATSGVVNLVTARPVTGEFQGAVDGEYANFESYKVKGMLNVPIGETLAVRVAGYYLNRDGYTTNLFDGSNIDGREMYAVRGSLRWEPGPDTTVDLMGYYFHERDDRLRIQKQQCQRDPTGVLGCLNARLEFGKNNQNATFPAVLASREVFALNGISPLLGLGLGSLYGPDGHAGFVEPADFRTVNTPVTPEYFTDELQIQGRFEHDFGPVSLSLTGLYQKVQVDSRQDYNLSVVNRAGYAPALNALAFYAANGLPTGIANPPFIPGSSAYFAPIAAALIPGGPNGQLCTSNTTSGGLGAFGGDGICSDVPISIDRSAGKNTSWSGEAIFSSDFDGPFNFLLGGIYAESKTTEGDYFVNAFAIDYFSGVFGSFTSFANGLPPSFLGTSFFQNHNEVFNLKSYGIFGEAYFDLTDTVKITAGLRYNNDDKFVSANSTLASFLVPYGQTGTVFDSPFAAGYDADEITPGIQAFQERNAKFDEITGRAVIDWQVTPNNLLYASYSRGYKSGGINPPLQAVLQVPEAFSPEFINAFEIGSKNTFANGALQLNVTAFYYKYKDLQLSRIVARTAVNDNIDADIYGVEAEAIVRPSPKMMINLGFSYLHTEIKDDTLFINQRDPSGGNPNSVIIKDISEAFNCAVVANVGGAATAIGFVTQVNNGINASRGLTAANGLRPPTAFPSNSGLGAPAGAFSLCSALETAAAGTGGAITVFGSGVPISINGNKLPQAPNVKFSTGVQYTIDFASGMTLVPRADLTYTGESFGNIFNGNVNRIRGYAQANAQIQLNGADDRWYVRGFIQNIFDSDSVTGQYLTDQSSGLFTNVFTLDPRRYGVGVGFKF